MKIEKLKTVISSCVNDVLFDYNRQKCGITSTVKNYIPTFTVWYGDKHREYSSIDALFNDNFFDNKSLNDIAVEIDFSFA